MANYKDSSLPVEERLKDLMQRMTFEEKIDQITCLVTITEEIPDFKEYVPNGIGNVGAFTVADSVEEIVKYADKLQRYLVLHRNYFFHPDKRQMVLHRPHTFLCVNEYIHG